ncbi:MAG TPA: helix-turn-helix domain-containing protein [Armatimonadota bacterium]|nr:helix-turn-helix domain-containing protein [Armatimonadota bacterium]
MLLSPSSLRSGSEGDEGAPQKCSPAFCPRYNVEMLIAHKTVCAPDWRWENHAGDGDILNLWCVTEGCGTLQLRNHTYSLRAGDCFVIRMREYCLGEHDPDHPLTVLWALYRYRNFSGMPFEQELPPVYRYLVNLPFFSQVFERAITSFNSEGVTRFYAEPWMSAALAALDEQDRQPQPHEPERELFERIQQLCSHIQASPGRQYRVSELAEEFHYTAGHFTRLFRQFIGVTPREYITQVRIDAAKSLLSLSNYSISRIAEVLGYRDVFYFSRQFLEQTGMSPSAFRHRLTSLDGKVPVMVPGITEGE